MRVVVTGIGCINALGHDYETIWKRICNGESGITKIPYWNTDSYETSIGGCIKEFNFGEFFTKKELSRIDPTHQLAIVVAINALKDANLLGQTFNKRKAGIFIGTSLAGMISGQKYHKALLNNKALKPSYVQNYMMHTLLDHLTRTTGFLGPRSLISTACTASTIAIAHAVESIRLGQVDIIIAGGIDPLCEFSFAGFSSMKNVSNEACAPFSSPAGLTLGEGAGMLILESLDNATSRGARIYAELAGYAITADAYHNTAPDISGQGQKNLLIKALENSNTDLEEIGYINAHGTGTIGNDSVEAKGIQLAFSNHLDKIRVSSSKGAIGHTLGAAGAIEAIITILAVYNSKIPPTANFKEVRSNCNLPHVKVGEIKNFTSAITQNYAFGGNNAALVIKKHGVSEKTPTFNHRNHRVVITGIGLITPLGIGINEFHNSLINSYSGITSQYKFPDSHKEYTAGVVKGFDPKQYSKADFRRIDRISQLTICAIEMAIKNAQLHGFKELITSMGIVLGTDCGPLASTIKFHEPIARGDPLKVNPILFPNTVLNAGAGSASIYLKLKGPNIALNVGEASGLRAVMYAYDLIKSGNAKCMVTGGVDEVSSFKLDAYYKAILPIFKETKTQNISSTPFDSRRKNMVLSEGAVFFVLENLDCAVNRGAKILGEILGHYSGADQPIIRGWDPSGEGVSRVMTTALDNSNCNVSDIDFIAAGALSDSTHDQIEAKAINHTFCNKIPVSAFSSVVGVSSATAPMSLAASILGFNNNFFPAQINYKNFDPSCNLQIINEFIKNNWNTAMINAFSHGGFNASLVVKKC